MKPHPKIHTNGLKKFNEIKNKLENSFENLDFTNSIYKNSKEKIKVICKYHGEIEMSASLILQGKNCRKCAHEKSRNSNATFIKKSNEKHKNKYDYSLTEYTINRNKVKIICPIHGEFEQVAKHHLAGAGCYKCGNRNKKGWKEKDYKNIKTILYHIKIGELYKIGLTTKSVKHRYSRDNIKYEILDEIIFEDGAEAYRTEQEYLQKTKDFTYYGDNILLAGNTELRTKKFNLIL